MALGHERLDVYRLLSRLGGRGYQVRESGEAYPAGGTDVDPDSDSDLDEIKPQQRGGGDGIRLRLTADVSGPTYNLKWYSITVDQATEEIR